MSPTTFPTATNTGSILPILIARQILTSTQASALPVGADNATIELFLRLNNLATEEQLLQCYAELYSIPFVRLRGKVIAPEVVGLIPEMTARRYDIIAFEEKDKVVSVALASPGRLKSEQKKGLLHQLQSEIKYKIAPVFSPLADIREAFANYEQLSPTVPVAQAPAAPVQPTATDQGAEYQPTSLTNVTIPRQILMKIPYAVAERYQFVAFAEPEPNHFNIAAIDPASKATHQVIDYFQKQNNVKVTLFQADESSIAHGLAQYQTAGDPNGPQPLTSTPVLKGNEAMLPHEQEQATGPAPAVAPGVTPAATGLNAAVQAQAQAQSQPAPAKPEKTEQIPGVKNAPEVTADQLLIMGDQLQTMKSASSGMGEELIGGKPKPGSENSLDTFLGGEMKTTQDLINLVKAGNVPKMVAGIVSLAVSLRASDIHIEAEKDKIRLRYRVDGELEDVLMMPRVLLAPLVSRIKILSTMKIDENRVPQDGRFGVVYKGRDIDLRVSNLPTIYGEKVVIRILDKATGIINLEDMGVDGINLERLVTNVTKPYGIVLSTGPTGSGKSTTLYAVLHKISRPDVNVVTLEDPVEYEMTGINQVQIRPKIGFTFAEGLRSILRQDPNIIMVGEIRDKETAEMATHAALTGHLVLSTLHTNTAAGALPRLINMGIESFLITSSINAIVGQRLVRRLCPDCQVEDSVPQGTIDELAKDLKDSNVEDKFKNPADMKFKKGQGCPNCHNGYKGRIGIYEVLPMSEEIEALAVKNRPASEIEEQALKEGMITMKQDGIVKALKGLTTLEEVMKATTE